MNRKSKNGRVAPGSQRRSLGRLAVVLPSLLSGASALGCGDMIEFEGGSQTVSACVASAGCLPDSIKVLSEAGGTSASASRQLAATWTRSSPGTLMVRASDNGLWLASTRDASLVLVHLSEQGDLSAETVIPGPPPARGTRVLGDMRALTEHASGPVVTVEWSYFSLTGEPCNDYYTAYGDPRGVQCEDKLAETLLFDAAQLSTPTRLKTCTGAKHAYCYPVTAMRSRDGQTVLTTTGVDAVHLQELSGKQSVLMLPSNVWPLDGVSTDGASWLLYATNGGSFGSGRRDLVTIDGVTVSKVTALEGADATSEDSGLGRVFTGAMPHQAIVVLEGGQTGSAGLRQGSGRQPPRDITDGQVPRDIKVLRIDHAAVVGQQTLARQSFAELRLEQAGVDDAGNVFIATATGDRAAVVANTLTPLLCRLPPAGEGACVQLPGRAAEMQVSHSGVVFVRLGDDISRFDFAP
jgi:hypothetical protein